MLAPLLLHKDSKDQLKEKALYLLEKVGLKDKADSYPNQLSGGQNKELLLQELWQWNLMLCYLMNQHLHLILK